MEEINIEAGLRQLSACLRKIKPLLAWADLVEAEAKPGTPPSFRIDRCTAQDLLNQCGAFTMTAMDLHDVLNAKRHDIRSQAARQRWKKRLLRLEAEFRNLDLSGRFIKV